MRRLVVVGTYPNTTTWRKGNRALVGSVSARRIERWADAPPLETWADTRNLVEDPNHWSVQLAQEAAGRYVATWVNRRIVFLGTPAHAALDLGWLQWGRRGDNDVAVCPHPSGLNRFWNDPENVALAKKFWKRVYNSGNPW